MINDRKKFGVISPTTVDIAQSSPKSVSTPAWEPFRTPVSQVTLPQSVQNTTTIGGSTAATVSGRSRWQNIVRNRQASMSINPSSGRDRWNDYVARSKVSAYQELRELPEIEHFDASSIAALGIGDLDFDTLRQMAYDGKIVITDPGNRQRLTVSWADGWGPEGYKKSAADLATPLRTRTSAAGATGDILPTEIHGGQQEYGFLYPEEKKIDYPGYRITPGSEEQKALVDSILAVKMGDFERAAELAQYWKEEDARREAGIYHHHLTDPKFADYAAKGAAVENPSYYDAVRSGAEIGNIVTFARENADNIKRAVAAGSQGRVDPDGTINLALYMTNNEADMYNYLLAKEGPDKAAEYLASIENTLRARYGKRQAESIQEMKGDNLLENLDYIINSGWLGYRAGLDQTGSGFKQLLSDDKIDPSSTSYANYFFSKDLENIDKVAYGIVNQVGSMTPMLLTTIAAQAIGVPEPVTAALGATMVGLPAAGSAYTEALEKGYDKGSAKLYAACIGASEAGLQYLLGGISKAGGIAADDLLTKVAAWDKAVFRFAGAVAVKGGAEALEENLQNFLEPLFRTMIFGEKYDLPTWEEIIYTSLISFVTANLMESGEITDITIHGDGTNGVGQNSGKNAAASAINAAIEKVTGKKSTQSAQNAAESASVGKGVAAQVEAANAATGAGASSTGVNSQSARDEALAATIRQGQEKLARAEAEKKSDELTPQQKSFFDSFFGREKTVSESDTVKESQNMNAEQLRRQIEAEYAAGQMTDEEYDAALDALMEQESLEGVNTLDRYNPEMMKAEVNDNVRGSVSDDSSQRAAGEGAGEQAGELAEGAGRDQSGQVQSELARDRADHVARIYGTEGQQPVTARSYLGSKYAEDSGQIYDVPQSVIDGDTELSEIAADIRSRGLVPHLFTGEARLVNGSTADAMIRGNDVYIRVDSPAWTATQNWEHEKFHGILGKSREMIRDLWQQMRKKMPKEKLWAICERYREAYHGILDVDADGNPITGEELTYRVAEEILADAYAGKDTFAQDVKQFSDIANDAASQIEKSGEEIRGPPEEKMSAAGVKAKTADLDALSRAEEMERRGIDEDTIYRDTGWYREADGMWRFWISDRDMKYRRGGDAEFRRNHSEYVEHQELTEKMLLGTLTEEEHQRLLELDEVWDRERERFSERVARGNVTLGDILDHPGLFEAYPELKEVGVRFGALESGEKGHYNRSRNEIVLSDSLMNAPEATLLHEIQHVIQKIEGFSGGSNPLFWAAKDAESRVIQQDLVAQRREIMDKLSKDDLNKYVRYKELERELERLETAEDGTPEGDQYIRYDRESDRLYLELYYKDWFKQLDWIENNLSGDRHDVYEKYYRMTAGEREAREVARRRDWSDEQLRASRPYQGEEVVFADGVETSASIKRTSKMTLSEQLKRYYDGKMLTGDAFYFGETPDVLSKSGFEKLPLAMTISNFKKSTKEKHNVPRRVLKTIESKLAKPLFSFGSDGKVAIVVDDIDSNGDKMLVAIHGNKTMDREPINEITSMYGIEHPAEWINNQIKDGKEFVLYNEERTNTYLQTYGYLASMGDGIRSLIDTVPQERKSVKADESFSASAVESEEVPKPEQNSVQDLPKKAQRILETEERKLTNLLANALRIPYKSRGEQLDGIARAITTEFLQTGSVSEKTVEDLFEKAYRPQEQKLAEEHGIFIEEYRDQMEQDFKAQVNNLIAQLRLANRYAADQAADGTGTSNAVPTLADLPGLYADMKSARRAADKAVARNLLTESDNMKVNRLLRGDIDETMLNPLTDNVAGILEVFQAKTEYEKFARKIRSWNKQRKAELYALADKLLETAGEWKDKTVGLLYSRETMERNIRDIVKDKKVAEEIINTLFKPIHDAEAAANKMKNQYRDRVRALKLSRKVASGNAISEAAAVQLLGEAEDNIRYLQTNKFIKERDGKSLEDWQGIVQDLWENNPNLDAAKIRNAVNEFRKIYDELFEQMNDARMRNGYEPVNYRKGYFPHFQSDSGDGILGQFGKSLGINTAALQLPTTINGMTHTFKPGIQWFGSAQQRQGVNTSFDAVEGFDSYIEGVADVIHQTDNIQRLRAFATQVRYRTSDEGLRKQIDKVRDDPTIAEEDKQNRIKEIFENGKFELGNFAVELDEYTNLLAGKKSRHDRDMEQKLGRRMYAIMKAVEGRVAANMVAVNPGSWLTNFIPITQGWATLDSRSLLAGMWDTLRAYKNDDGIVAMSSFLTNRRGSDPIVRTWAQGASDVLSKPMSFIDSFTADSLVRARYNQNIRRGMSEDAAIADADAWAAGVMADRSKGATPTIFAQSNPITKLFTQFQLEVNNQLSYTFKDIPRETREKGAAALAMALLKFMIGAFLYDELYEYFIGRRPALDPLGIINDTVGDLTGYELPNLVELGVGAFTGDMPSFEVEKKGVYDAGVNLATAVAEELPFVGGLLGGGRVPISSALPDVGKLWQAATDDSWAGEKRLSTAAKELAKPAAYILPPFGGGQVKKAVEGGAAVYRGGSYSVDSTGEDVLQYPIANDTFGQAGLNAISAMLFGKSSLPAAREWVESGFDGLTVKQTALYDSLREGGVSTEDAYGLIRDVEDADTNLEKISEVANSSLDEFLKELAMSNVMTDSQYEKYMDARRAGVSSSAYYKFLSKIDTLKTARGSKSVSQDDVKTALDESGMTDAQKRAIWNSYGWKTESPW